MFNIYDDRFVDGNTFQEYSIANNNASLKHKMSKKGYIEGETYLIGTG
jgi:hypothetical protein